MPILLPGDATPGLEIEDQRASSREEVIVPAATKTTKVLIADDHGLMRAALKRALSAEDVEVVGEARDGLTLLSLVEEHRPDVVLLDVNMPVLDGLTCLTRMRSRYPHVGVLMLSASSDAAVVAEAAERGARGYVSKTATPAELGDAIRAATTPGEFMTRGIEGGANKAVSQLTEREVLVLDGLFRGRTNREIAQSLWVSEQTVKFHLRNVYRKLGVSSRAEAVEAAYGDAPPGRAD